MSGRKRVLIIAPSLNGDDVGESWLAYQWASRSAARHDVTVLTSFGAGRPRPSTQLPGVRVVEWREPRVPRRLERFNSLANPGYPRFHRRARRWLRRELRDGEGFDVVHQVTPVSLRYPSPAVGLGVPVVHGPVGGSLDSPPAFVHEEGAAPWYQRLRALDAVRLRFDPLLRRSFESADCIVGIAPYVRERLAGLRVRRFEAMSDVALDAVRAPVDRSGRTGPIRLLHVGRIVRTKGLRDVIRALGRVGDLEVVLDVLGEGNDRPACEELVQELGLQERVRFHGRVPREEVDAFYERADVFVFPSYREPGGNVVLEAMSAGLPSILCDRGGPAANADDTCAILLPAVSPEQLAVDCAEAIRALATDEPRRRRMGAAARRRVESTHLWSQRLDRMAELYDAVSSPPRSIRSGAV